MSLKNQLRKSVQVDLEKISEGSFNSNWSYGSHGT